MIRDQRGAELQPDDLVLLPCRVVQMADALNHRNLHVECLTGDRPGVPGHALWLNGRQVVKGELPEGDETTPAVDPAVQDELRRSLATKEGRDAFRQSVSAPQ